MTGRHTVLVVVAHPDDETFGCGSLIAHASAAGARTVVACATRGEAGTPTPGRGLDDVDLATVRESELRAAATLLGVDRVVLFDWRDSGMDGEPPTGSLVGASTSDVAAAIAELVDDERPDVVVTLDASDGHRDHAHVRDATLGAVQRSDHAVERVYLHCLPQALMRRWVAALEERQPGSDHLEMGDLGTPEDEITTVIDTERLLGLREEAIAVHRSQTPPFDVMPAELRREFLVVDHLKRVVPAWTGGPIETELLPTAGAG